jgi:hypothetical protein
VDRSSRGRGRLGTEFVCDAQVNRMLPSGGSSS